MFSYRYKYLFFTISWNTYGRSAFMPEGLTYKMEFVVTLVFGCCDGDDDNSNALLKDELKSIYAKLDELKKEIMIPRLYNCSFCSGRRLCWQFFLLFRCQHYEVQRSVLLPNECFQSTQLWTTLKKYSYQFLRGNVEIILPFRGACNFFSWFPWGNPSECRW